MNKALQWVLGGRPMKYKCFLLSPNKDHKELGLYEDTYGRSWMAAGPWSLFRIPLNQQDLDIINGEFPTCIKEILEQERQP
jgi:hypothetical protein